MTAPALPVASKGTSLQAYVSSAYVSVASVISLDLPEQETETYESDYLANPGPGIPYSPTYRTEGGKCSGELWLDPTLSAAGQSLFSTLLTAPSTSNWSVIFRGNPFATPFPVWNFAAAGITLGGTVALKEGIKGKFSLKLNGIVGIATSTSTG